MKDLVIAAATGLKQLVNLTAGWVAKMVLKHTVLQHVELDTTIEGLMGFVDLGKVYFQVNGY